MKQGISILKKLVCGVLLFGLVLLFSACSAEESNRNSEYYDQLNSYTDTLLMQNRELNKVKEKWNYKDKASTEEYISKLSEVEESIGKIRNLDATEALEEIDANLKGFCDTALECIALTKSTAQNACDTGDISIYNKNDEEKSEAYDEAYNDIITSVEEVRVKIR